MSCLKELKLNIKLWSKTNHRQLS